MKKLFKRMKNHTAGNFSLFSVFFLLLGFYLQFFPHPFELLGLGCIVFALQLIVVQMCVVGYIDRRVKDMVTACVLKQMGDLCATLMKEKR